MLDWRHFLTRWSRDLLQTNLAENLSPPPRSKDWLGFPPASARQIKALETRLGLPLPPSYKSFLLTTNGWRRTTFAIARIRPANKVDWYRVEDKYQISTSPEHGSDLPDEDYYHYTKIGAMDNRADHVASLVQISDVDDAVYLLNPQAVTPDGEWEAWFYANWVPGAIRFPSFAHLMLDEYLTFRKVQKVRTPTPQLPRLKIPHFKVPRTPAPGLLSARTPGFNELIEAMQSGNKTTRASAARTPVGKLHGRTRTKPRPALVEPLTALFHASKDPHVRAACVAAVAEFAPDRRHPPAPLLESVSDANPAVVLAGISALPYFHDIRAVEPLCRFIESGVDPLVGEKAMLALHRLADKRAIPTLQRALLKSTNPSERMAEAAAIALAALGEEGFAVLEGALAHRNPHIRHAAVVGIDISGNRRASKLLDHMQKDGDPKVRDRASVKLASFFGKSNFPF